LTVYTYNVNVNNDADNVIRAVITIEATASVDMFSSISKLYSYILRDSYFEQCIYLG